MPEERLPPTFSHWRKLRRVHIDNLVEWRRTFRTIASGSGQRTRASLRSIDCTRPMTRDGPTNDHCGNHNDDDMTTNDDIHGKKGSPPPARRTACPNELVSTAAPTRCAARPRHIWATGYAERPIRVKSSQDRTNGSSPALFAFSCPDMVHGIDDEDDRQRRTDNRVR
jgi:hypothetical protein